MFVKLLHATPAPVYVAGLAAMVCQHPDEAVRVATEYGMPTATMEKLCEVCRQSGHMSVFEHINYTFLIDGISRACSHQLVRHRLASFTQASQRHSHQSVFIHPEGMSEEQEQTWRQSIRLSAQTYRLLMEMGMPREDARSVLPNAASTTLIMTMNARELAHFLELRLCNKAQTEIRELAQEIYKLAREHFPLLFKHVGPPCLKDICHEKNPCGRPVTLGDGRSFLMTKTDNGKGRVVAELREVTQMPENEDEG